FETRPINPMEGDTPTSGSRSLQAAHPDSGSRDLQVASPSSPPKGGGYQTAPPRPVTPTAGDTAPVKSWMDEIDERIRLKAMNAPISLKAKPAPASSSGLAPSGSSRSDKEKPEGPLGSGISEEEVDRIMKEFS